MPNHIQKIVDYIKAEPEEMALDSNISNYYDEAVKANVLHGVHTLQNSEPVLAELIKNKQVKIIGCIFEIGTGEISIVEE
jgi:carbonic anhydrase